MNSEQRAERNKQIKADIEAGMTREAIGEKHGMDPHYICTLAASWGMKTIGEHPVYADRSARKLAIVKDIKDGRTAADIVCRHHVTRERVRQIAVEHDLPIARSRRLEKERAKAKELYRRIMRAKTVDGRREVADEEGMRLSSLLVRLAKYGYHVGHIGSPTNRSYRALKLLLDGLTPGEVAEKLGTVSEVISQIADRAREAGFKIPKGRAAWLKAVAKRNGRPARAKKSPAI